MSKSNILWLTIIIAGWLYFIIPAFVPATYWMEVNRVHVGDAFVGQTPIMTVDRKIKRNILGRWTVNVFKKSSKGYYSYCSAHGVNDYQPDAVMPDYPNLNLDWWTWPVKCKLEVGTYRVKTLWTLYPVNYPTKELRNVSNEFLIKER